MEILNVQGEKVKAAASFEYKGVTISLSSIMSRVGRVDCVAAWGGDFGDLQAFSTVEAAIDRINEDAL